MCFLKVHSARLKYIILAITPNGQFMLVACRDSHVIQVFKLNKKTGMMVDTKQDIKVGKPVCVQFAN